MYLISSEMSNEKPRKIYTVGCDCSSMTLNIWSIALFPTPRVRNRTWRDKNSAYSCYSWMKSLWYSRSMIGTTLWTRKASLSRTREDDYEKIHEWIKISLYLAFKYCLVINWSAYTEISYTKYMWSCKTTNGLTVTPSAKALCVGDSPLSGGGCHEVSYWWGPNRHSVYLKGPTIGELLDISKKNISCIYSRSLDQIDVPRLIVYHGPLQRSKILVEG